MTTAMLAARRGLIDLQRMLREPLYWRALVPMGLLALAWQVPGAGRIIVDTIAEAYLQVSVFVAATLALIHGAERLFRFDLAAAMAHHRRAQVPFAAFLGALPGCGGAIVVVTQYVNGHVGFGGLIAVLTATMGDAAFLLLSREPSTALLVFALGMGVGTLSGYVIEGIHGPDFLRREAIAGPAEARRRAAIGRRPRQMRRLDPAWIALMLPGMVLAIPIAARIDANAWFGALAPYEPVTWLGFAGGVLALLMWSAHLSAGPGVLHGPETPSDHAGAGPDERRPGRPSLRARVINDTNFVTVWVIAAFLLFELAVLISGAELGGWFAVWAPLTPLIAVLVGFLPGCGPQIIVTTLYLTGAIPMAALLGNAISNDGDALFPAIALAPRAAIVATLYTGIPALIVGYGAYLLMA